MAQKGYPGAVNNPPPPTVYTYPNSTVVVQQQQPTVVHKSSRGLFGQIGHEINMLGRTVGRELDWTADQINRSLSTTATSQVLTLFQSGNVIQLVSRASGRSLQIVQGPTGLVVDGLGPDNAFNAQWTVVNEGANQVRLHNNNNFLAIINGATVVMHMPPGSVHTNDTKFQMTQLGQFIVFSSMREPGKHIGILPNGQLKAALATGREDHGQFGVRLIHSPHGVRK